MSWLVHCRAIVPTPPPSPFIDSDDRFYLPPLTGQSRGTFREEWVSKIKMKSLIIMLLLTVAFAGVVNAQKQPQFDVATVKLSPPVQPGVPLSINLGFIRNGTATLTNTTLSECLQFAYGIVSDTQIAGPDWIKARSDVRFDVVAKAPPDTPQDQVLLMMQGLLAERLKLAVHHEKREMPFLALVVAKNGPKLLPAKEGGDAPRLGAGRIIHPRLPMSLLGTLLSRFERQIVIDLTGLTGSFAVDLQWTPDAVRDRAPQYGAPLLINGQTVDLNGPSVYTALQEQLGLRLESRKGPVDALVVDHAERVPADN